MVNQWSWVGGIYPWENIIISHASSAYNVYEYSLSPCVLHIIMCMNIHCAKKQRIWPNTGEMMTFIQQQMILLTVDTTQSYIQMATIHTCTPWM